MTPRIAVCLQTCDRLDYTRRTLETFVAHNVWHGRWDPIHGDDGSTDPAVFDLVQAAGFETVVRHATRQGARATRGDLFRAAAERGADWVLLLENDWEWARPFPWDLFEHLTATRPDVYSLRLYGAYKGRNRTYPCSTANQGKPARSIVPWWPLPGSPEPCEIGRMHWGAPPAVTRITELLQIQRIVDGHPEPGDRQEMYASGRVDAYVARVTSNVVFHIGQERTRGPQTRRPVSTMAAPRPAARPPLYSADWQQTRTWTHDASARCLLTLLASYKTPPSALLDVGCGTGHLVDLARKRGVDSLGVDLSIPEDNSAPQLRHADLCQPLSLGRTFPTVLCWEVAEHLPPDAADTLCDSLVTHLADGGLLFFTAATPGQGGQGHLTERPHAFWREKFEARGLKYEPRRTEILALQWKVVAAKTPWYGKNLQVFRKRAAVEIDAPQSAVSSQQSNPRIAITMRTADRSPNPNYLGGTITRLLAQGIPPADVHVCVTDPDTAWLDRELGAVKDQLSLHVPETPRTPNENGLAQIASLDPNAYDWVLLLEDDLAFCADFVGSVQRWIADHAKRNRHLYRLFGFRVQPPRAHAGAYDSTLERCAGSQAVLLRMADAQDFVSWARANLETWGGFRGNARIAFDKLLASWVQARWGTEPGVMAHPMFVKHVGKVSSLHPKTAHMDQAFGGGRWSYGQVTPAAPPVRVPKLWTDATVVCIGGGTVTQEEVDAIRGRAHVVVINDGYKLAPWADALYAADSAWWSAHQGVKDFAGLKFAVARPGNEKSTPAFPADVQVLKNDARAGLSQQSDRLRTGGAGLPHSGHQAIGLAVLLGAKRVVLLGYDLQRLANGRVHWFGSHPAPLNNPSANNFAAYRTQLESLVAPAKALGVEILNASTHTAVDCFPKVTLAAALQIEAVA